MSTFLSDYPNADDETAAAATRAALNGRRPDVVDEPTPRGWRLNLLTAGSVAGVILLVAGGVCLGLLLGARPESEGLTDAELWTQNTDLMARSAFAVIALFLGGIVLLFVGAGHLYRQERREIVKALAALSRRPSCQMYAPNVIPIEDMRAVKNLSAKLGRDVDPNA